MGQSPHHFVTFAPGAGKVVYAVASSGGDVFKISRVDLSPAGGQQFKQVADLYIQGGKGVGASAMDAKNNRLLVVDGPGEKLYQLDLGKPHQRSIYLSRTLGRCRALALDAAGNLYAATEGHLWRIQLNGASSKVEPFAVRLKFRSPAALAISQDGKVWVADEDGHAIYLVSPTGDLVGALR